MLSYDVPIPYLPTLDRERLRCWNASYMRARKLRQGGTWSRAYVNKAGKVAIRKGGNFGSNRDEAWQLAQYRNAMTRQGREAAFQVAA